MLSASEQICTTEYSVLRLILDDEKRDQEAEKILGNINRVRLIGDVAIVTASTGFYPLRKISEVNRRLAEFYFDGLVVFDLLAVNGLTENRFASMIFKAGTLDTSSFSTEVHPIDKIKDQQDALARLDENFLKETVLSTDEVKGFLGNRRV